nr:hypothetical protein B0A51_06533 [Rachicladosporium sp. CCFEE 5018]
MPPTTFHLLPRETHTTISSTMLNLLIAFLVLLIASVLLVGALLYFRQRRRSSKSQLALPLFNEKRTSTSSSHSSHRRIMVRPSEPIYVVQEKQNLMNNSDSPPPSPVPEIRITFPEEVDDAGRRTSGRVVVVRVGETSIGLEPVDDSLPTYQRDGKRFQSLDLDRIGGLTEKEFAK